MNSCILMAQIVQEPQLRFTPDQMAIAEMLVEFSERGSQDPSRLKVVGWGNLAQEIQKSYHQGDRVIIEGRLTINSLQQDGYKEKRAELTVLKIYPLGGGDNIVSSSVSNTDESLSYETRLPATVKSSYNPTTPTDTDDEPENSGSNTRLKPPAPQPDYASNADNDDIPF